jgi:endonuclease/exonuclease/phosphatase family metal-dependent hydrolase
MLVQRISIMTFNLWQTLNSPANWPQRRQPMIECLKTFTPDVLCVQELHPLFDQVIREALPTHSSVRDDFMGWTHEGNIYWNANLFESIDYGTVDIGMKEPLRRLFWVLLKVKSSEQAVEEPEVKRQILVTTAHYTWEGHIDERQTDRNLRKSQARLTGAALHDLKGKFNDPALPVLFMGDLNESYHPRRILREAGFVDCFNALRLPPPATHPQRPSQPQEDILSDASLDWIMHNNFARPILANVLRNLICTGGHVVSDHCPVMCIYEIGAGPYPLILAQDFSGTNIVD